jgi:hypothetical protein
MEQKAENKWLEADRNSQMYEFITIWRIEAPLDRVWAEIKASETWPDWWRGVLKVEKLRDGDESGVGAVHRSTWKSALPYKLVFDSEILQIRELESIEIRAFGELEGSGIWTLTAENDSTTRVRYDWRVETNKSWMKTFAPLLKPFFRWNHDVIMGWGGEGLARRLDCRILENR